ncbi:Phospholipase/carboxylesterase/thioesterase, partial [Daedaleopsis nitida]
GLGDSGHGWESVAEMFARQSSLQHIKWVLPHAPSSPVTANNGMKMPSWFDVFEFGNINAREDEEGMLKSMHAINQLITAEVDAGGAMTLLTGITNERRLAGLSVMSGWLPIRNTAKTMVSDHAKKLPIFWGHGTADPIVRFEKAQLSLEFLKKNMGLAVVEPDQVLSGGIEFHPYEGLPHSADEQELEDLQTFLKKVIPAQE